MTSSKSSFQGIERLEDRTFFSATDFSDFQTPAIELGPNATVSVSDTLATADEVDYYSFVAPADGKVTITMNGSDELDSMLELFNFKGRRIKRNNNISRRDNDSSLAMRVRAGQVYYIGANSFRARTAGDYDLTLTSTPNDDYSDDPQDAQQMRVNRRGRGRKAGRVNYATDVDLLKVTATRDGVMTAVMGGLGRAALEMCHVSVSNMAGEQLAVGEGFGASAAEIRFAVTAGETYYIYASATDDSVGRYRIAMDTTDEVLPPTPDPEPEPDPDPDPQDDGGDEVPVEDGGQLSLAGIDAITVSDVLSAGYYTINDADWLVFIGTDGSDVIELGFADGAIQLNDGTAITAFDADVDGVLVLGFGGDDVIRADATLNYRTVIDAGLGSDRIYKASDAAGELSGGDGDDLLVSIGGGADRLIGSGGLDSFWVDSADTVADADAAETQARSVHVVTAFYQPYTDNRDAAQYVPLTIAGQNLTDPQATSFATGWRNYADHPLFAGSPLFSDIDQGGIGDCYFLSVLAGYAHDEPEIIEQMVTDLGDGTYAVRFFNGGDEVYLRVDADLPTRAGSPAYAGLGGDGELWVAIAEKAYAHFRYGQNTYDSLNSGWMHTVYSEVSGRDATLKWTYGMTSNSLLAYVQTHLLAGDTVSVGSGSGGAGPIAGSHAYSVLSVDFEGNQGYVTVYNPWGVDGRTYDSDYNDGVLRITAEQFKSAFVAVALSYA